MIINKKQKIDTDSDIIKVVVDIEKEILSAVCDLHIDCADELFNSENSERKNLWGANVDLKNKNIAYFSMINLRPGINKSTEILIENIRDKVKEIIEKLIFFK